MIALSSRNNRKKEPKRNLVKHIGVIIATKKAILPIGASKTPKTQTKAKAAKERVKLKEKAKVVVEKGKAAKENQKADVPMEITQLTISLKQSIMPTQLHLALVGVNGQMSKKKDRHPQNGKTTTFLLLKRKKTNLSKNLNQKLKTDLCLFYLKKNYLKNLKYHGL